MIKPTIGRVILLYRPGASDQFEPALISYVHSDTLIDVSGVGRDGRAFALTSVRLDQDRTPDPIWLPKLDENEAFAPFACWMPYQRQAAARDAASPASA